MSVFFRFLKWFENNWNERIPKAPYSIYTKNSYSHNATRKLLSKAWSEDEAINKVKNLQEQYNGVLFFFESNR